MCQRRKQAGNPPPLRGTLSKPFLSLRKRLESGMYLRQPAAYRINSDPGIETIPSLREGSIMRGDSPAKSANIMPRDVSSSLANRNGSASTSRKHVNPASRRSPRQSTEFRGNPNHAVGMPNPPTILAQY